MKLQYHALARREVIEISVYYSKKREGLGDEFLAEVDEFVAQILKNPFRFEEIRIGIRRCVLQQFPYGIYFRMPDANTVRIIVVRHHSRRPGFGMRRQ